MPGTARGVGLADPFDPEQAIPAAARLLGGHLRAFGSAPLALAAYNAGPGAVSRYGGVPPYAETQAYVARVMALAAGPRHAARPGAVAEIGASQPGTYHRRIALRMTRPYSAADALERWTAAAPRPPIETSAA
jgi:hypothetical protein